jgi:FtsP/CotA-like multicopper oxidase with cupredoxin domain
MKMHSHEHHGDEAANFSTAVSGLAPAVASEVLDLADGDTLDLRIAPVVKRLGDAEVRMLSYNGSVPGPTLRVRQGSELVVNVSNEADLEATVHWHGLRLDNRFDGTHETQQPIPVGGTFTYRIEFPDAGVYWYHPHIREDYGQEMGLYGNILVVPAVADYWPPVHREVPLTLDDVLVEDGKIASFSRTETTYAAMGRFGNVILVGGETDLALRAIAGEVVRFYLTNTANTRVFNVALPGARLKLVGGDSGRYEREEFVDSVILAPSERAVVDVLFTEPGQLTLEHRTPDRTYALAVVDVEAGAAEPRLADEFDVLRHNVEWAAERGRLAPYFDAPPDKTLAFVAEMDMGGPEAGAGTMVYGCPMDPEVIATWAGKCPKCGMKLLALEPETARPTAYVCPMHPEVAASWAGTCPDCGMALRPTHRGTSAGEDVSASTHGEAAMVDHAHHGHAHHGGGGHGHDAAGGIEWEDDMVDVNRVTTRANMHWNLIDRETGAVNHAIDWQFRVGDLVKLRLVNEMDSDHPMHHPFHIHGAGRFVVLARDGVDEENLVWKDTVLLKTGATVDILLDVTNAGVWMAHCHIAEHHESGMMFSFNVASA